MNQILPVIPVSTLIAFVATLLLFVVGYTLSISAGFKSDKGKGLRFLLVVPVTNPLGLVLLLSRDLKQALPASIIYLLALSTLPVSGSMTESTERARLQNYVATVESQGISLNPKDLEPPPVPAEQNVWNHPFLELLATAAAHDESGQEARNVLADKNQSPYTVLQAPVQARGLHYPKNPEGHPLRSAQHPSHPLWRAHRSATSILWNDTPDVLQDTPPNSWPEVAEIIKTHYLKAADSTTQLEEAVSRPSDIYPHQWEQNFSMLLPHLSYLKGMTGASVVRSQAASVLGDSENAFRYINLCFQLADIGDSDLLISRLVQMAQIHITSDALWTAQQYHSGDATKWNNVLSQLEKIDFLKLLKPSLSAERAFGHATLLPISEERFSDAVRSIDAFNPTLVRPELSLSFPQWISQMALDIFLGSSGRAVILKNWTNCLLAYEEFINNIEATQQKTTTAPWNTCQVPPTSKPIHKFGLFAKMLLPALDGAFNKALRAQHKIELSKTAITLELYYLEHGEYPEKLSDLAPQFSSETPLDPMTGDPWRYERLETNGFLLYSVGRDGIDDQGIRTTRNRSGETPKDDDGWLIFPELPPLPEFSIEPAKS